MDQCFYVPEILRLICDELTGKNLLSTALACRALLEPGLDKLWSHITSFKPLIACLPDDLFKAGELGFHTGLGFRCQKISLVRVLTPEDLARYKTYYAHRIRTLELKGRIAEILSIEAFQALQLATESEPGALSPRISTLVWTAFSREPSQGARESSDHIFPYYSLFLGRSIGSMSFSIRSNYILHLTSIQHVSRVLPNLKELIIEGDTFGSNKQPFIGTVLTTSWNRLELLKVSVLAGTDIPLLSSLPGLRTLHVDNLKSVPRLQQPGKDGKDAPAATVPVDGFPSLSSLSLTAETTLEVVIAFLQYLRPSNQILNLECFARSVSPNADYQELIHTIQHHINPQTLRSLKLQDLVSSPGEDLDLDLDSSLDIKLLSSFSNLQELSIGLAQGIWLTPEDATSIPTVWPGLTKLKLGVEYPDSRIPRINHTHFLSILQGCKSLDTLGLRFDATHITKNDAMRGVGGGPFPLRYLFVGDSPIYSPNRVGAFLGAYCPKLVRLAFCVDTDRAENGFSTPFEVRWDHVMVLHH